MSGFCCKKLHFLSKKVPLLKAIVCELCWRFFSSAFSFCKAKDYCYWKHNFCRLCIRNPASRVLQIDQKQKKWQWRRNFPTWRHRQLFWRYFVSLVKFSYRSKFHFNIIIGSGITTIFFYKGLTRLSFAQYLKTGTSYGYQVWHECL